jgi:hypothetical protein
MVPKMSKARQGSIDESDVTDWLLPGATALLASLRLSPSLLSLGCLNQCFHRLGEIILVTLGK